MAGLEDFFAKRDKKKSSKKKFDTAEDLAKVLGDKVKLKKELETGKSNYLAEGRQSPGPGLPIGGDDEWMEAEEKKPDFSNLKIQELVLTSDDEDSPSQEGKENEVGEDGGPWKKKTQSKSDKEASKDADKDKDEATVAPEEKDKAENKSEGGDSDESSKAGEKEKDGEGEREPKKYIPPSQRRQQPGAPAPTPAPFDPMSSGAGGAPASAGAGGGAYVPPSRRGTPASGPTLAPTAPKKRVGAPTLQDEDSFPSLS